MAVHQADVHLRFFRLQLFIDPHSPLDGKLVHRKLILQDLVTTPIHPDILLNSPACCTFITRDSLGFGFCYNSLVTKCSSVVTVPN